MTRLNLFLELMEIVHNLLQDDITSCNVYEARIAMDCAFDRFEENEGLPTSDREKSFEATFFNVGHLPLEIKQYCYTIEGFHAENEIYLEALPSHYKAQRVEQAQLVIGLFDILNELLTKGINGSNNYEARTQIYDLFDYFSEVEDTIKAELFQKLLNEENEEVNQEWLGMVRDDMTDSLRHFFPDLDVFSLTLFPNIFS